MAARPDGVASCKNEGAAAAGFQARAREASDLMEFHFTSLVNAVVYACAGIVLFLASFTFVDRMTPYDLWEEIVRNKNVALAVLVGAISLGISIIIAAAVH